ncbi:MAG: hypothetical protein PHT40_01305 [Patescibacteria group bacterium]|nr:hypothetical protein [Patescibacteria group bacterium]
MKKLLIIIGIVVVVIGAAGFFVLPKIAGQRQGGPGQGGSPCAVAAGEWVPQRGECPGTGVEMRTKCNEFCEKHPDCCGERNENAGGSFGGREEILPLPADKVISRLKRNYPATIKALNEGPNIYTREGPAEIFSEEKLEKIKAIGFNTIQVLLIGKKENGQLVFNEVNNAVLLNDIVAIKKQGLAVWVALDIAGVPANMGVGNSLGDYEIFKASFLEFTKKSAELMEQYKVEYFTPNNEPDKPFKEQKNWSATEVNNNLADFLPATNAAAREKFSGKLINKITQAEHHAQKVIDASFQNVDIAGVDVGPAMDEHTNLTRYKEEFESYQYYATLAEKAGVPWMNAEYWQGDFDSGYSNFAKNNELEYSKISFDAYLKVVPKGKGYVWNDIRTFSLPQGEETKNALTEFFNKI